ncbi:class I SAM-dependent methyltransferase [Streptomyces hoynatensis]|uniref:Class I SAM-dependent methyltransferase n=1 Tax=Streptomyces hoynatensis TaxID=1141874 RepID=A0A3A9Z3M6_9ACTN|nr:class I SAM-dependent methyltransferase [Streptomyces hoynatensis]RKN43041.1 class I SAM-dependent methyltransferase [Streptomyces hoynatensis]
MTTVADHYEDLLAAHYTWMLGGDIEAVAAAQAELLRGLGLSRRPGEQATAVDLGCGPGPQTLALARLGHASVTAVDTSATLLAELVAHAGRAGLAPAVHPVHADLRGVLPRTVAPGSVATLVCMGDTLPHLPGRPDVQQLIADIATALRPGGSFVATYRDLTRELRGHDRFLPVRSCADRILTCFLDYLDEDVVLVHDLLHTRRDGAWHLKTGSYPKLRLAPAWLAAQCRAAGLEIRHDEATPSGLRLLHAAKP